MECLKPVDIVVGNNKNNVGQVEFVLKFKEYKTYAIEKYKLNT
jgi:hypothetical protein